MSYKVKFFDFVPTVVDQQNKPVSGGGVTSIAFPEQAVFTIKGTSYELSGSATAKITVNGKDFTNVPVSP